MLSWFYQKIVREQLSISWISLLITMLLHCLLITIRGLREILHWLGPCCAVLFYQICDLSDTWRGGLLALLKIGDESRTTKRCVKILNAWSRSWSRNFHPQGDKLEGTKTWNRGISKKRFIEFTDAYNGAFCENSQL